MGTWQPQRFSWEKHCPFLKLEATVKMPGNSTVVDKVVCPACNFFFQTVFWFPLKELLNGALWTITRAPNHLYGKGGLVTQTRPTSLEFDVPFYPSSELLTTLILLQEFLPPSVWKGPGTRPCSNLIFSHALILGAFATLPVSFFCLELPVISEPGNQRTLNKSQRETQNQDFPIPYQSVLCSVGLVKSSQRGNRKTP